MQPSVVLAGRSTRGPARSAIAQFAVVVAIAVLIVWLGYNASQNMAQRNISFGFDFLFKPAGFDIPFHLIPWEISDSYGYALVVTFFNMLFCAALAIVAASALGLALALMRLSGHPLASGTSRGVIEVVRNTPQLVQIVFIYFAVLQSLPGPRQSLALGLGVLLNVRGLFMPWPSEFRLDWALPLGIAALACAGAALWASGRPLRPALPWLLLVFAVGLVAGGVWSSQWDAPALRGFNVAGGVRLPPELLALWLGISIYTSPFIAEVIRGAVMGVPHGQTEAAMSLGLSWWRTMRLIVLPQALRIAIPPLTSQYLNIIKSTTLGAAIAYPEVLQIFARTVLNQTGRAVECMTLILALFLAINLLTSAAMNAWNRRLGLQSR